MTISQLNYIIALDTYKNFVAAAEYCHISQPALSMQIQKLESDLGVKIFDRSSTPVQTTPLGKKIIKQAKITLSEAKKINEIIFNEINELEGELTIGIIPTLAPYLLPLFLKQFLDEFPKLKLTIKELTTEKMIETLNNDDLDIGIMATPLNNPELSETLLFYEELLLYVSSNSKLNNNKIAQIKDINPEDLWLLEEGHCLRSQIIKLCELKKSSSYPEFKAGSLETLIRIVDKYQGITVLPKLATVDFSESKQNHILEFENPKPYREISLVCSNNYPRKKIIERLKESILSNLPFLDENTDKRNIIELNY
jgi:LysR family transcriptional regulator, hydrogen peroxide-inducible genes activator